MSLNTILATAPLTSTGFHLKANGTTLGQSLIWDNGTNVGIGNTNTSYTLDVSGTGRFTSTLTLGTMTAGSVLFAGTSGVISQNNGNLFYDNTNTRLGINAGTSPAYTLSVGGTGNFTGALTGTSLALSTTLGINNGTAGTSYIQFNYNPVDPRCKSWRLWNDQYQYGDFAISQATTQGGSTYADKFVISTLGDVLINDSSINDYAKLQVTASSGVVLGLANPSSAAAGVGNVIQAWGTSGYNTLGEIDFLWDAAANTNAYMAFKTRGSGVLTERMRIGSDGKVGIGLTTWYQPYTKLIVGGAIAYNNNGDAAVSDNSYGQSFAKKINIVAGSGANTIYSAAGSEAALYVVTGLNLTNSSRFADIILYLGAGSTAPVVISSQTYSTGVTRTYANAGENLTLSLTGNSNTYTIRMTGIGANERT